MCAVKLSYASMLSAMDSWQCTRDAQLFALSIAQEFAALREFDSKATTLEKMFRDRAGEDEVYVRLAQHASRCGSGVYVRQRIVLLMRQMCGGHVWIALYASVDWNLTCTPACVYDVERRHALNDRAQVER